MAEKLVSVIIPAYNAEKFLATALDSVLTQTYQEFEILVVNDGSEDGTEEIVKDYQRKFPDKIRYFYQKNRGQGSARNLAMKNARGDYFAFLDADDLWLPEKLEKQLRKLEETEADFCFTDAEIIGETGAIQKTFSQLVLPPQNEILTPLLKTNFIVNSSVLMKRVVFEKIGFQKERRVYQNIEDYDYWLQAALAGFKFVYLPEVLVRYRIHSTQSSKKSPFQSLEALMAMYMTLIFNSKVLLRGKVLKVVEMLLRHTKTFVLLNLKSISEKIID